MTRETEGQVRAGWEEPACRQSGEECQEKILNDKTGSDSPLPLWPSSHHVYLAIEGLVTLADLLSLLVAAGGDQLQYGLFVTA